MFPFVDAGVIDAVMESTVGSSTPAQGRGNTKRADTVVEQATLALFRVSLPRVRVGSVLRHATGVRGHASHRELSHRWG